MSQITHRLRTQMETYLADATTGFNATYIATAPTYSVLATSVIDFTGAGHNYFRAQVDPETLGRGGTISYPVMCLYGTTGESINDQKFQLFSGPVTLVIDYHISWKQNHVQFDFESVPDCVEDTMIQIANRTANQTWDFETVYNGNIGWVRGPVKQAASGFRQSLRFSMRFEVETT